MSRRLIRKKVHSLVKKYGTTDPYELSSFLGVPIYYRDLGKNIMGFRSSINRASMILLNSRNSYEEDYIVCGHELGHHCCGHSRNADKLTKDNMRFIAQGDEFEANFFLVSLLTYGINLSEYPTKQNFLDSCGIPDWAQGYVDWDYLEETANFDSFNSCY